MSIYKTAMWMTVAIIGSKLIGFVREILFANYFGASYISDAYFMAFSIPTIIFGGIFTSVAISYIPIYSEIHAQEGVKKAELFTNKLLNILFLVLLTIAFIGVVFSKEIVRILASGFAGDTYEVTVYFVRISFLNMVASSLTGIFSSYLKYHNRFILTTLIGYSFNFALLVTIVISGYYSYYFLIWGLLIAQLVQLVLMSVGASKNGYQYRFVIGIKDKNIKRLVLISIPIFIGNFAGQINAFVDKMLASKLPEGSVAALNYGNQINNVVYELLTMAVITIIYPLFSKQVASKNIQTLQKSVIKSLNFVIIVLLPVSVGLMILRTPIIRIIYERGVFDETATQMTAITLLYFSIGMIGIGVRDVLSKAFFSLSDTKTPMINGIICMVINVTLNLLLINRMGIAGLALSTSIAAVLSSIFMFLSFSRKYKTLEYKKIFTVLIKTFIGVIVMGACVYFLNDFIMNLKLNLIYQIIGLITISLTGALLYFVMMKVQRVEELDLFIKGKK